MSDDADLLEMTAFADLEALSRDDPTLCRCWLAPFESPTPDRLDPLCSIHRPAKAETCS